MNRPVLGTSGWARRPGLTIGHGSFEGRYGVRLVLGPSEGFFAWKALILTGGFSQGRFWRDGVSRQLGAPPAVALTRAVLPGPSRPPGALGIPETQSSLSLPPTPCGPVPPGLGAWPRPVAGWDGASGMGQENGWTLRPRTVVWGSAGSPGGDLSGSGPESVAMVRFRVQRR